MKKAFDREVRLAQEIKPASLNVHRSLGMMYIRARLVDKLVIKITPNSCMCKAGSSQGQLVYVEGEFFKPHEENPSEHNMVRTLAICLAPPHRDVLASISRNL